MISCNFGDDYGTEKLLHMPHFNRSQLSIFSECRLAQTHPQTTYIRSNLFSLRQIEYLCLFRIIVNVFKCILDNNGF